MDFACYFGRGRHKITGSILYLPHGIYIIKCLFSEFCRIWLNDGSMVIYNYRFGIFHKALLNVNVLTGKVYEVCFVLTLEIVELANRGCSVPVFGIAVFDFEEPGELLIVHDYAAIYELCRLQ